MSLLTIKAARRHALVTLEGFDTVWHTMAGGGRGVQMIEDPLSDLGEMIPGPVRAENIVLTTSFSPRTDLEWIRELKLGVGVLRRAVIRQWTDENWTHIGDPEVYPDCLLIGYTAPTTAPTGEDVDFSITLATTGEAL